MLEKQRPGFSVTAFKDGEVIYQNAFGKANIEADKDATVDTKFAIASMTKIFATFGLMQPIDQGLAELDDPIEMHLPDLPNEEWKSSNHRCEACRCAFMVVTCKADIAVRPCNCPIYSIKSHFVLPPEFLIFF